MEFLDKIKAHLENGSKAINMVLDNDEIELINTYNLLTYKPVIYAANVSEDDLVNDGETNIHVKKVRELAEAEHSEVFEIGRAHV